MRPQARVACVDDEDDGSACNRVILWCKFAQVLALRPGEVHGVHACFVVCSKMRRIVTVTLGYVLCLTKASVNMQSVAHRSWGHTCTTRQGVIAPCFRCNPAATPRNTLRINAEMHINCIKRRLCAVSVLDMTWHLSALVSLLTRHTLA